MLVEFLNFFAKEKHVVLEDLFEAVMEFFDEEGRLLESAFQEIYPETIEDTVALVKKFVFNYEEHYITRPDLYAHDRGVLYTHPRHSAHLETALDYLQHEKVIRRTERNGQEVFEVILCANETW